MRRRILGLMMSLVLVVTVLPMEMVQAETQPAAVYVSDTGDDSNTGTSAASAVKSINQALELAEDGATIYVDGSVYITPLGGTDNPLVIDKSVTIVGEDETNMPTINVRTGGVILGADVTFKNINYAPESFIRPGIAANGHTLNLINVHQEASTRPLQIYGGTLYDITETTDFGTSYVGSASVINIVGGSYEAVYAGSVNGNFDKSVEVNVAKTEGENSYTLSLDAIYAGGTQKLESSEAGSIPMLTDEYSVGDMSVVISNASVKTVSGMKDSNNVSLTVGSENLYSCTIDNIDNLMVTEGVFAPTGTWNSQMNVTLSGSATDKATLDLSGFAQALAVQNFTDNSAPNILVLPDYEGTDASLVINGAHLGTTELRTGGGMPWSDAENVGYSGKMEYEHTYVEVADESGSFVIKYPYPMQGEYVDGEYSGITLEENAVNGVTAWTTSADEFEPLVELVSFSITEEVLETTYERINFYESGEWPCVNFDIVFTEESYNPDISFVPISYKVTCGDGVYEFTTNSDITVYNIEELNLCLDAYATVMYVTKMQEGANGDVSAGEYVIQLTVPTSEGMVTDSIKVVVLPEEGTATPSPTSTASPTAEPSPTPTLEPTASPTASPTAEPSPMPTLEPTASPTASPTATPTLEPTSSPTARPTAEPSPTPTATPTAEPTSSPTAEPTASPTSTPTAEPTTTPTAEPTATPTAEPTASPTAEPTSTPTTEPTASPTATPMVEPTATPSPEPTSSPTAEPTSTPTAEPTASPTATPAPPVSGGETQITYQNGLSSVPAGLLNTSYDTLDKITEALQSRITQNSGFHSENTELWDVVLKVKSSDGENWLLVTAENFPREGLDIVLPYPEGTSGETHDFVVSHMFTSNVNGHQPGELENPTVTKGADGLHLRVDGLSPFMIGYKEVEEDFSDKPATTAEPVQTPQAEDTVKSPKMGDGISPIWIIVISLLSIGLFMMTIGIRKYDDFEF